MNDQFDQLLPIGNKVGGMTTKKLFITLLLFLELFVGCQGQIVSGELRNLTEHPSGGSPSKTLSSNPSDKPTPIHNPSEMPSEMPSRSPSFQKSDNAGYSGGLAYTAESLIECRTAIESNEGGGGGGQSDYDRGLQQLS